jgi:hypothetical protein
MNGRTIAGIVLTLLLVVGAAAIGITAYNAGVTAGLVSSGQVVVAPGAAVGPYVGGYGYGYGVGHGGFGFFGFLGTLLFIFLLFALFRALIGGGRGRWGGGWGGPGGRHGAGPWTDRAREIHDELHRSSGETGINPDQQPRS